MKLNKKLFALLILGAIITSFVSADPITVRYTRWAGGEENKTFKALIEEFNKSQTAVKVKLELLPWAAYWQKIRAGILSGDAADVISLSNATSSDAGAYLSKGTFLDLSKFPGGNETLAKMAPSTQGSVKSGNKILAMPVGIGVRSLIYNKDLLKKAGIPFPDAEKPMTWDQFAELAKKLSIKDSKGVYSQYTAYFSYTEMWENVLNAYGVKSMDNYFNPSKITLNNADGIAALTFFQKMFTDGVVPPNTGEWQTAWGNPDNAIATGKVAFMHTGPWSLSAVEQAKIDYGTAPLPTGKVRSTRGYINSVAIFKGTKVKDAAWTFVKWLAEKEGQMAFAKLVHGDLPANVEVANLAKNQNLYPYKAEVIKAFFSELAFVTGGPLLPTTDYQSMVEQVITDLTNAKLTPAQTAAKIEKDGNAIIATLE